MSIDNLISSEKPVDIALPTQQSFNKYSKKVVNLRKKQIEIGDNNKFTGFISVGSEGEMGAKGDILLDDGCITIGNYNVLREFITINSPVKKKYTSIGNNCYFMTGSHVPHDTKMGDHVIMANNSLFGG